MLIGMMMAAPSTTSTNSFIQPALMALRAMSSFLRT